MATGSMTDNPTQKVTRPEDKSPLRSSKMSHPWVFHVVHKATLQGSNSSEGQSEHRLP